MSQERERERERAKSSNPQIYVWIHLRSSQPSVKECNRHQRTNIRKLMEPDELSTGPLWLKYDGEQSTRAEPGRQINHRLFLTELKRGPTPPQKQYRPDKLQTRTFQNLIKLILTPTLKREREREIGRKGKETRTIRLQHNGVKIKTE